MEDRDTFKSLAKNSISFDFGELGLRRLGFVQYF